MQFNFILSLIFATFIAIFALKNSDKVLIDFIFTKVNISQAIVIFISAILGAVIVAILGSIKNFKFKKEIKELKNKLATIEEDRDNLIFLLETKEKEKIDKTEDTLSVDDSPDNLR